MDGKNLHLWRSWRTWFTTVVILLIGWVAFFSLREQHPDDYCSGLAFLLEESSSRFESIADLPSEIARRYETDYDLPEAKECIIFEDAAKASYQCTWEFPLSSPEAEIKYEALVGETRICLEGKAIEQLDAPVNHPDIYRASYYDLTDGLIAIALKNKSEFSKTLVSVRVDGPSN